MRLKKSRAAAEEDLKRLVTDGYRLVEDVDEDYAKKAAAKTFDPKADLAAASEKLESWAHQTVVTLQEIFLTDLEVHTFLNPEIPFGAFRNRLLSHVEFDQFRYRLPHLVRWLDKIRVRLDEYTDLPVAARLYVEDIDSFSKVRDVNPGAVADVLKEGRIELAEEHLQLALEQILNVSFHRLDWGGETNDMYTANVLVNGARTATAFALKGKGCKARELTIADCGKNGDQLVRLLESPADLFVVQYVGPVSDAVIKDIDGKVEHRRGLGKPGWYCVIDGQDTARVLRAYGQLAARDRSEGS